MSKPSMAPKAPQGPAGTDQCINAHGAFRGAGHQCTHSAFWGAGHQCTHSAGTDFCINAHTARLGWLGINAHTAQAQITASMHTQRALGSRATAARPLAQSFLHRQQFYDCGQVCRQANMLMGKSVDKHTLRGQAGIFAWAIGSPAAGKLPRHPCYRRICLMSSLLHTHTHTHSHTHKSRARTHAACAPFIAGACVQDFALSVAWLTLSRLKHYVNPGLPHHRALLLCL